MCTMNMKYSRKSEKEEPLLLVNVLWKKLEFELELNKDG